MMMMMMTTMMMKTLSECTNIVIIKRRSGSTVYPVYGILIYATARYCYCILYYYI